jgi:hypothetical protein
MAVSLGIDTDGTFTDLTGVRSTKRPVGQKCR